MPGSERREPRRAWFLDGDPLAVKVVGPSWGAQGPERFVGPTVGSYRDAQARVVVPAELTDRVEERVREWRDYMHDGATLEVDVAVLEEELSVERIDGWIRWTGARTGQVLDQPIGALLGASWRVLIATGGVPALVATAGLAGGLDAFALALFGVPVAVALWVLWKDDGIDPTPRRLR